MLTTKILQIIQYRDRYERLKRALDLRHFSPFCTEMVKLFGKYFSEFPDHKVIQPDVCLTFYATGFKKSPKESDLAMVEDQLAAITQVACDDTSVKGLIRSLQELAYSTDLAQLVKKYDDGEDIDIFTEMDVLKKQYERDLKRSVDIDWIRDDIADILEDEERGIKINWRLKPLRMAMPDMRTGMQVIIAFRPDKGKTSFTMDQITYMAKKLPPEAGDRPIIVFNNEGKGQRLKTTCYRSALKATTQELTEAGGAACREAYVKEVGDLDRIRIFDIQGLNTYQLEMIIEEQNPIIVVWDMLDNVKGFGDLARKDLTVEELYKWARDLAVIHDFLSLPTSQISADGEGVMWCTQAMLKDSKTGKQGACDGIVMVGHSAEPSLIRQRYVFCPKNKLVPAIGARADCMQPVYFEWEKAHFQDP